MKAILSAFGSLLLVLFMSIPAMAGVDLSRYRCEDPDMKSVISDMLSKLKFDNGRSFASEGFTAGSITSISTVSASRDKLVCKLTVSLNFRGSTQPIRGKFIIRQFSNGKLTAEWSPFS